MVELSEDRVELVRYWTKWANVAVSSLCRLTISSVSWILETSVQVPQPPQVEWRLMQLGLVTACGRICLHRKKINISTVLAGQRLGIKEVDEGIWLVSFIDYDLGYIDPRALRSVRRRSANRPQPLPSGEANEGRARAIVSGGTQCALALGHCHTGVGRCGPAPSGRGKTARALATFMARDAVAFYAE